jgi:hypothetical protein
VVNQKYCGRRKKLFKELKDNSSTIGVRIVENGDNSYLLRSSVMGRCQQK